MGPVRALWPGRCAECRGPFARGDSIVLISDMPVHVECEKSAGPWDTEPETEMAPSILALAMIVARRGALGAAMVDANFDRDKIDALPEAVSRALWLAVTSENELFSLLADVAAEHHKETNANDR